jgi:Protein of unknown function (DUF1353)
MVHKFCDGKLILKTWSLVLLAGVVVSLQDARAREPVLDELQRERKDFLIAAREEDRKRTWKQTWEDLQDKLSGRRYNRYLVPPTGLQPFADWDYFYVKGGSMAWHSNSGQHYDPVVVPENFVTDLASIPRAFWQILRPEGRHTYAAVVHDYLYWTQKRTREEADSIFKIALEDSKVSSKTVETLYHAVRVFGQSAWDKNAKLRKSGECRLLKKVPKDFRITWNEWKKRPGICASNKLAKSDHQGALVMPKTSLHPTCYRGLRPLQ